MATSQENLARFQEISNRGLQANLSPDKRAIFDEALSRGLITPPVQVDVPDGIPGVSDSVSAPRDMGVVDTAIGVANLGNIAATQLAEQAVGGLAGIAQTFNPFAAEGAGAVASESVQEAIPNVELTSQGQEVIQSISNKFDAAPEFVKNIVSEFVNLGPNVGETVFQATGSPLAATIAGGIPEALEAASGIGGARAVKPNLIRAIDSTVDATQDAASKGAGLFTRQSPAKRRIAELIQSGSTDIDTARFKLADDIKRPQVGFGPDSGKVVPDVSVPGGQRVVRATPKPAKAAKVVKDAPAIDAIKQGFDEGVIADVKQASKADKRAMLKMVDIAGRVKSNKKFGLTNRPGDVAGDTLMQRLDVVRKANRDAGKAIAPVVESLRGKRVDSTNVGNSFADDLANMGITASRGEDGIIKGNFSGSDIEGLAGPESVINRVLKRVSSDKPLDARELHSLKRFIDEQVTFGKNAEGLAGEAERTLKKLRTNINQTLGDSFPRYAEVNKQYSETINALDAFQDVAGKKMDLTGPNADSATGTLMRRLMSNAQSRVRLLDSINQIEDVADRFGGKLTGQKLISGKVDKGLKNDLLSQVLFADELDAVFGPAARTSLQGQFDQALKQGVNAAASPAGATTEAVGVLGKGIEKVRGINERAAFKSIKELLKEK